MRNCVHFEWRLGEVEQNVVATLPKQATGKPSEVRTFGFEAWNNTLQILGPWARRGTRVLVWAVRSSTGYVYWLTN
jgi:hypothetical protein